MIRVLGLMVAAIALLALAPSSRAALVVYAANLNGLSEAPPNVSPGTGYAEVDFDAVAHTLRVQVTFSGLLGTVTASHIHSATAVPGAGTAGVATSTPTFTGFPSGVTSGTYDHTFDTSLASSWNPTYVTANGGTPLSAEAAFGAGLAAGKNYLNIHTTVVPGGEIRGFLTPIPLPASAWTGLALMGGIGATKALRRKRS